MEVGSLSSHLLLCLQKQYKQIMEEQEALRSSIQDRQNLTLQFQQRSEKLQQDLQNDREHYRQKLEVEKVWTSLHRHHHHFSTFLGQTSPRPCSA